MGSNSLGAMAFIAIGIGLAYLVLTGRAGNLKTALLAQPAGTTTVQAPPAPALSQAQQVISNAINGPNALSGGPYPDNNPFPVNKPGTVPATQTPVIA